MARTASTNEHPRIRQARTALERLGIGLRCLTFELTPRAEAGTVSRDGDDGSAGAGPAYSACRSESGVERGVRRHRWRCPRIVPDETFSTDFGARPDLVQKMSLQINYLREFPERRHATSLGGLLEYGAVARMPTWPVAAPLY